AATILGRSCYVEDVVAEVLERLWEAPERFDPKRGSLVGFLRLQARRRSIDLLRAEASRRRREVTAGKPAPIPGPEDQTLAYHQARGVHLAVSALPSGERAAIELAYFLGMSYRAAAVALGEPEGTVKSRINKGLRRLRDGWHGAEPHLPQGVLPRGVRADRL
ncbi:MAG: RNA polymerase sigma factor, partial [Acidimicrobiales bacterium]